MWPKQCVYLVNKTEISDLQMDNICLDRSVPNLESTLGLHGYIYGCIDVEASGLAVYIVCKISE